MKAKTTKTKKIKFSTKKLSKFRSPKKLKPVKIK